jgi:hypothetical protein
MERNTKNATRTFVTLRDVEASDADALQCILRKYPWWFGSVGKMFIDAGGSVDCLGTFDRELTPAQLDGLNKLR